MSTNVGLLFKLTREELLIHFTDRVRYCLENDMPDKAIVFDKLAKHLDDGDTFLLTGEELQEIEFI